MATSIGVIGSGTVGQTLARGFSQHGHPVVLGTRDTAKLLLWQSEKAPGVQLGAVAAAAACDVVIVAVAGNAAEEICRGVATQLAGKVVIDTNNPIAGPPVDGWIPYFTGPDSLLERLQLAVPEARFVKAFSSVGNALMIDPQLQGGPPTMFICGNDAEAKGVVRALLAEVGWESEDAGKAVAARAIEALCQLWCARGFVHGQWMHAFKLLKA